MANKTRWICAGVTVVAILGALGAGLWFGGGLNTRSGWEAASWVAGVTGALGLAANVVVWVLTQTEQTNQNEISSTPFDTHNTVSRNVTGGTVIQGRDVHVDNSSYSGNRNDFRGGTFNGPFINQQHNHQPNDESTESDR